MICCEPGACAKCRAERQKLYKHMTDAVHDEHLAKLQRAVKKFAEVREELRHVHADVDLNVLEGAQVVGMTTNGVASKQELVAAMTSKVKAPAPHQQSFIDQVEITCAECAEPFALSPVHCFITYSV